MKHMWVLYYSHSSGHDIALYTSEKECRKHALSIVKSWRDDFDIDASISDEDALKNWHELTNLDETLEIDSYTVNEKF